MTDVDRVGPRRRPAWVPLATAAVAASLLTSTVDGSQAVVTSSPVPVPAPVTGTTTAAGTLDSTPTGVSQDSTATAGTLLLTLRERGAGFTQPVLGLAPGDSASRYVDLIETGTLDGRNLTLAIATTGALAPALGLRLESCRGGTWNTAIGVCNGVQETLLTASTLTALKAPQLLDRLGPARRLPLRLTLTLADRQEEAVNGVLPARSLQGATASLRWTFRVVQR